ncbi:MAG: Ig-like domain-containing protein, partial [Spirochaetes bacterium]|nr:Ig-like domain-containing protein [Spirochaetota bacterium]
MVHRSYFKHLFVTIFLILSFSLFADTIFSKSKTTEKELKVIAVSPSGGTEGVRESDAITVTFSEAVVPLSKLGKPLTEGPITLSYNTKGTFKWLGTKTVAFYPETAFPKNTRINASVKKGLRSVSKKELQEDYTWSFDTKRPGFNRSDPYNMQKWVRLDEPVRLYFDIPMKKDDIDKYIIINENGINRSFSIRYINTNELSTWERSGYDVRKVLVLVPDREFKKDSKIVIILKAGLPAIEGHLGMKKSTSFYFNTYYRFSYTGETLQDIMPMDYRYCDVLSLLFTNPVEYRELYKHLTFSPVIKLPHESFEDSTWNTHKFCLSLEYKPETSYKVTISKDLKDIFGQALGEDIHLDVNVGSFLPGIYMPGGMGVVEAYEGRKIPITLINPETIDVSSSVLTRDEVIPYLLSKNYFYIPYNTKHTYKHVEKFKKNYVHRYSTDWLPKVGKNKMEIVPVHLSSFMEKKKYGYLDLQLSGIHHFERRDINTFVQVTGLGITGKFSAEGNLIFVTDLKNAVPIKNADIQIRDDFNTILWNGKTDQNGIARSPGWLNFNLKKYSYQAVRQWAFVRKGEDETFINNEWGTGVDSWRFGVWSYPDADYPYYQGSITTERGLYRPGEIVYFKGVLREKVKGDWKICPVKTLDYSIKDSRYNEIKKGTVNFNEFGTFSLKYTIPEDSPTGYYSITVFEKEKKDIKSKIKPQEERDLQPMVGKVNIYNSFRVEVFQPVQFDVRIWCEDRKYILDDTVQFKVTGWYLFGAPMSDKNAYYNVSGIETFYSPPDNPGYRFSRLQWLDDNYYYPKSEHLVSKTT